jgi:hypothetical protein
MTEFRKTGKCPPSSDLLLFQRGHASNAARMTISEHLRWCEFCVAEVEFYAHYPQRDEWVRPEPIPAPLYDLAQALLRRGRNGLSWLDTLFHTSKKN